MRKRLPGTLRLALCAVALWFVGRGLSSQDSLVLRADQTVLSGTIREVGEHVTVHLSDGTTRSVKRSAIAVDENGAARLSYGLKSVWHNSGKLMLLCAVGVFCFVPLLQGVRLQWLLRAQRIQLGWWESIKLAFAGNFLNFAAPFGSTAGDVFKAYYASLHTARKTEAATMVFIDRAIGLGTLLASVTVIAVLAGSQSRFAPLRPYLLAMLASGVAGCLLYVAPFVRKSRAVRLLVERLPWRDQLRRIDATARCLLARKGILAGSVALTLILQTFAAGAFFCICLALGMGVGSTNLSSVYAYFSTGEIVKALPGPPQGLGTMELAYGYFFAGLGSTAQIVSAALAIRLVNLVCALPGVAITATGAYRPRAVVSAETATDEAKLAEVIAQAA